MSPLPSIYGDEEPISDPEIREVYNGEIARRVAQVRARCGDAAMVFGEGGLPDDGYSTFGLFEAPKGGLTRERR